MLPPNARGTITYIAPAGEYTIAEDVIEVEFQGERKVRGSFLGSGGLKPSFGKDPAWLFGEQSALRRNAIPHIDVDNNLDCSTVSVLQSARHEPTHSGYRQA